MNPLVTELQTARAVFRAAWDAVPQSCLGEAPAADAWSAHLVLSHVARTESQVARLVRGLWEGRPESLPRRDDGEELASRLDEFRVVDRSRRFQAPTFAEPDAKRSPEELWRRLDDALTRLTEVAEASVDFDVSALRQPHPIMGTFDLHQWILFSAHHERRHAEQLQEVAAALG